MIDRLKKSRGSRMKRWTWDELMEGVRAISLINEPIEDVVEPEIEPKTARERADRRWGLKRLSGKELGK
jgi:hypothetical protein